MFLFLFGDDRWGEECCITCPASNRSMDLVVMDRVHLGRFSAVRLTRGPFKRNRRPSSPSLRPFWISRAPSAVTRRWYFGVHFVGIPKILWPSPGPPRSDVPRRKSFFLFLFTINNSLRSKEKKKHLGPIKVERRDEGGRGFCLSVEIIKFYDEPRDFVAGSIFSSSFSPGLPLRSQL